MQHYMQSFIFQYRRKILRTIADHLFMFLQFLTTFTLMKLLTNMLIA